MKYKFFLTALAAGALTFAGLLPAQAAHKALVGITFFSNEFIVINPETGAGQLVQKLDRNLSAYGLAEYQGRLYTFNPNTDQLVELSAFNGSVVRSFGTAVPDLQGEGDLAIRPSDGFGFLSTGLDGTGAQTNGFYTFNLQTGVFVKLGESSVTIDALAFDSANTLFALAQGESKLYRVDQTNGSLTVIGDLGVAINSPIGAMTFIGDRLYASIDDRLYEINKMTGAATQVSSTVLDFNYSSVSGLAYVDGAVVLGNLSGRAFIGTDERVSIGGLIITGSGNKRVVLRGIGPSLKMNGQPLAGRLADPVLTLYDSSGAMVATNDDYQRGSQPAIDNAGLAPSDPKESALLATLAPGTYTVIVNGKGQTTGIGLVETYDLDPGSGSKLANLSTRGFVESGNNKVIGGVIVQGTLNNRVVLRGIGPSLGPKGVQSALPDPTIQLVDGNGTVLATNDNVGQLPADQQAELDQRMLRPSDPKESALIATLGTGNYTVVLDGVTGATGVGLVEVYDVD